MAPFVSVMAELIVCLSPTVRWGDAKAGAKINYWYYIWRMTGSCSLWLLLYSDSIQKDLLKASAQLKMERLARKNKPLCQTDNWRTVRQRRTHQTGQDLFWKGRRWASNLGESSLRSWASKGGETTLSLALLKLGRAVKLVPPEWDTFWWSSLIWLEWETYWILKRR